MKEEIKQIEKADWYRKVKVLSDLDCGYRDNQNELDCGGCELYVYNECFIDLARKVVKE